MIAGNSAMPGSDLKIDLEQVLPVKYNPVPVLERILTIHSKITS